MAYANKYKTYFKRENFDFEILIQKLDYVGDLEELTILQDAIRLNSLFDGYFSTIVKQNIEIEILNDKTDFYQLEELLINEEKQFKVILNAYDKNNDNTKIILFDGYLEVNNSEQQYLDNSTISIQGTNYLSKLEIESLDDLISYDTIHVIELFHKILSKTTKELPINVNVQLWPFLGNRSVCTFDNMHVESELYIKNQIETESPLAIIESFLKSFGAYIYLYNNQWYIDRYEDIYVTGKTYYQYQYPNTTSTVTSYTEPVKDIYTALFRDKSQTISYIAGLKEINVKLNQKPYESLIYNKWENSTYTTDVKPMPIFRKWEYVTDITVSPFYFEKGINKGIVVHYNNDQHDKGIYTGFAIDTPSVNTLNFNFKGYIENEWMNTQRYKEQEVSIRYVLYNNIIDSKPQKYFYIDNGVWKSSDSEKVNEITIKGDNFSNAQNLYEFTDTFNINDVRDDLDLNESNLIIGFLPIKIKTKDGYEGWNFRTYYQNDSYIGDLLISTSSNTQESNLVKAKLNDNFTNIEDVDLDIFSTDDFSYKNETISDYGTGTIHRNTLYTDKNDVSKKLQHHLIISKYKLFNKTRKVLKGKIIDKVNLLKPFNFFKNSDDGNVYILGSYTFYPLLQEYDVELLEYDNTTDVNLIQ